MFASQPSIAPNGKTDWRGTRLIGLNRLNFNYVLLGVCDDERYSMASMVCHLSFICTTRWDPLSFDRVCHFSLHLSSGRAIEPIYMESIPFRFPSNSLTNLFDAGVDCSIQVLIQRKKRIICVRFVIFNDSGKGLFVRCLDVELLIYDDM